MSKHIDIDQSDGILHIRLNRPGKKNALDVAMYQALANAIKGANTDAATRVILISAAGDAFCSGNDLEDFLQNPPTDMSAPVFQFITALVNAEKPILAAVNGLAVGIGTTMLLHCDLVYASDAAVFNLPFVNLGVCAEGGSSLLLPMICGRQKAAEFLLCGEPFTAQEAHTMGMVTKITAANQLESTALARAAKIAKQPPNAMRVTKRLLKQPIKAQLEAAIQDEAEQFIALLQEEESRQIMAAFLSH